MASTRSPREVFERLSQGITGGDWSGLPALYAEDVVVRMPFALPSPVQLHGREQVREHFARSAGVELRTVGVRVHETTDPEVVIAEYDYEVNGSAPLANVQVLRVRDGLIVESRDYHHHAAIGAAIAGAAVEKPAGPFV